MSNTTDFFTEPFHAVGLENSLWEAVAVHKPKPIRLEISCARDNGFSFTDDVQLLRCVTRQVFSLLSCTKKVIILYQLT